MTAVSLHHLSKQYNNKGESAVSDVSLTIPDGQITALLGPSGCGKTTILKMIAGLLPPTRGMVQFDGQSVTQVPTEKRGAVMVFQNHLLFPFMSVAENVAFGLTMRGESKVVMQQKVTEMLALVKLPKMGDRRPSQLSGGQQQRVALARALVVEPKVLLLDEPLSNLDAHLRDEMRELILTIQQKLKLTTIVVTHDQEEAVILADQIALLFSGQLQQVGPARDFYERPLTPTIAQFFGNRNKIWAEEKAEGRVETAVGTLHLTQPQTTQKGWLTIRPEAICIPSEENAPNQLTATVRRATYTGTHTRLQLELTDGTQLQALASASHRLTIGQTCIISLPPDKLWVMTPEHK